MDQIGVEQVRAMSPEQLTAFCQKYADLREFAEIACKLLWRVKTPVTWLEAMAIQAEFRELLGFALLCGITPILEEKR